MGNHSGKSETLWGTYVFCKGKQLLSMAVDLCQEGAISSAPDVCYSRRDEYLVYVLFSFGGPLGTGTLEGPLGINQIRMTKLFYRECLGGTFLGTY